MGHMLTARFRVADGVSQLSSAFTVEAQLRRLMSASEWAARPVVVPLASGDLLVLERQVKALCEPKYDARISRLYEVTLARAMSYDHLRRGKIEREQWDAFYSTVISNEANVSVMDILGYEEFVARMQKTGLLPNNFSKRDFNELTLISAFTIHEIDRTFGAAALWRYLERVNEKLKSMAGKVDEEDNDILKWFHQERENAYQEAQQAAAVADRSPAPWDRARQADEERTQLLERIFSARDTEKA
jgi:hypothetical protein